MSSTPSFIAGLDIGTSSAKVLVVDEGTNPVIRTSQSYPLNTPHPGYAEQDPENIFEAVVSCLREAVQQLEGKGKLHAIGISCAMHSIVFVDHSGKPLTPLIIWADTRSGRQAETLKDSEAGYDIYRRTGTPIHPMSPLCKLIWFNENDPGLLKKACKMLSIKEYILWKLFNSYVVDHSIASATGLFDIFTRSWYTPSLDVCGLQESQLSVPVSSTHVLKGMVPNFSREIGIDASTPVVVGASDGCLANLGVLALNPSEAAITIGTSGAVRVTIPKPMTDPEKRLFTYILDDERYVLGGSINNGAISLEWFKNQFMQNKDETMEKLLKQTRDIPAGSSGLVCLPYFLGERAPHWNSFDRGVFFGVQYHHTSAHFLKAIIEGISLTLFQIARAIQEICEPVNIIYVNGGFARSPEWLQVLSDVFNIELTVRQTVEASATGAALLAIQALRNQKPQLDVENLQEATKHVYPNTTAHAHYRRSLPLFTSIYQKLQPEFISSYPSNLH